MKQLLYVTVATRFMSEVFLVRFYTLSSLMIKNCNKRLPVVVRYNINKVRQTTPLKCLYIDHQHIYIYSCHRYNRWDPGLPAGVVREFEGSTWSSGDRTDRSTTASHLHSPAVVRNTTSWEYCWLAGHQQVPEDPAAVGAGTCCIFQGFPP